MICAEHTDWVSAKPKGDPRPDYVWANTMWRNGDVYCSVRLLNYWEPEVDIAMRAQAKHGAILFEEHWYVPASWLAAQDPERADSFIGIETGVREYFGYKPGQSVKTTMQDEPSLNRKTRRAMEAFNRSRNKRNPAY